jgi:hypothetical protein
MKNDGYLGLKVLVLTLGVAVFASQAYAETYTTDSSGGKFFDVYSDANAESNHFFASGFMGDYSAISVKASQKLGVRSGSTCMRFTYNPPTSGLGAANWAGVQWQNPEGNWGIQNGGYDLTGAQRLTFWARGKVGGEKIDKFQVGGISSGEYPDSDQEAIGPITLSREWKQYTIDLSDSELSFIAGGFAWATSSQSNNGPITFYVDDIRYEF